MILVIDMNWKKDSLGYYEFVMPIIDTIRDLDDFNVRHFTEVITEDLNQCSRVVLSGTPLRDIGTLNQPEKFHWIEEIEKPVLGICAGMQTIGVMFGARLEKKLEIGMTNINTVRDNRLFSGGYQAYSLHSYCVGEVANFEVLAESAMCIQAIKHKDKEIFGVLFHPEVRNRSILKAFAAM